MLVLAFPAAAFGTNCYILAPAPGAECLVVDPGIGVVDTLQEVLAQHHLKPAAVLLTHGHLDHVWSVAPVCGADTAAYIHQLDRYRLTDPLASVEPAVLTMFEQQFGARATWHEPDTVVDLADGATLRLAGLPVTVTHAPGHTEGSVMFGLDEVPEGIDAPVERSVLTGDVIFAGSIGRTDLPGGDPQAMQASLRDMVVPLPDTTLLLPGHGPATTMAAERATNPFLQGLS
ncbi:MAG: MBL fold metallo-hydrolase [Nostocoides sp.]